MLKGLTAMIEEEATLAATPERKTLLVNMANTRGRLTAAVADLRGFLTTGDEKFRTGFEQKWQGATEAAATVKGTASLLTTTQGGAFATFDKVSTEFAATARRSSNCAADPPGTYPWRRSRRRSAAARLPILSN